jgi:transcriptional regulator with XRE-family HTH domain
MTSFGAYIRQRREELRQDSRAYSVRQVAHRIGVEPAYLSKVERDEVPPPSEDTISRLAAELGEDRDVLLALGGKVSADLLEAIRGRPRLFAELIRTLREAPDHAVLRVVREVVDGDW